MAPSNFSLQCAPCRNTCIAVAGPTSPTPTWLCLVCAAEPLLPCCAAAIGRGMNDVAFRAHAIQATMEQMLHAAALPILSDVQLSVPGLSHLQLFPDPIPDVFVGQPLLVSGKFAGPWPELIHISGTLPSGEREWGAGGQGFMAAAAVWNKVSC